MENRVLIYADDLMFLAPNSSGLKTALEELKLVARRWARREVLACWLLLL